VWPFRTRAERAEVAAELTQYESLRRRVAALEADRDEDRGTVVSLKSKVSALSVEWAEFLDKMTAWTNRQSARDRKKVHSNLEQVDDAPSLSLSEPRERSKEDLRRLARQRKGG